MYSSLYRYIFIHIPKCGGTSVEHALSRHSSESTGEKWARNHKAWRNKLLFELIDKHPDYYMFTFTRDPVDRCISAYNHFAGKHRCSLSQFLDGVDRFLSHSPEKIFRLIGDNKTIQTHIQLPKEWENCKLTQLIGYHILPQSYFIVSDNIKCFDISTINDKLIEISKELGMPRVCVKKSNPHIIDPTDRVCVDDVEKCKDRIRSLYSSDSMFT